MTRPEIRVLCVRANWEALQNFPPEELRYDTILVDVLKVPYYQSLGYLAVCDDPDDRDAFLAWKWLHPDA